LQICRFYRPSLLERFSFFREWYPVMLLPLLFKEVEFLAAGFGNWGLTDVLQNLEVDWFGGHPSLYLSELLPWIPLSEYLHFCYFAYLLLVPAVGSYWYFTGQKAEFQELVFLVSVTLTASYLFFALFPVDSPFYRFAPLGAPFEGHFFYDLVHFVAGQGGARGGAFPSSHASVATVVFLVVWHRERRLAYVLAPVVAGLIAATVYWRFHYALDAVAGLAFAVTVFGSYRLNGARVGYGEWRRERPITDTALSRRSAGRCLAENRTKSKPTRSPPGADRSHLPHPPAY
jgi:membrane-associated phospholipid phosphatase